ncbi:MAG: AAA family ATPase [bacterium]|nr:AAA family ATPase [bacterium]
MIYRFLEFELSEERFEVRRNGEPVLTQRKAFDFVRFLLVNRDRVVTHEELIDALWGGAARSLSTIPQCAASARRALGDSSTRQAVFQTVRGRGYRFVAEVEEADSTTPSLRVIPRGEAGDESDSAPFVGREELMSTLFATLGVSLSGEARVVFLSGEPGIGKTRAVEELSRKALEHGASVLTGRCYEGEGAPAFWPWIQIIREWNRNNDFADLSEDLKDEARFFSKWRPEVAGKNSNNSAQAGEGAELRFGLFDAATRGLRKFAADTPLVLVLEDLHWADPASLGLLRFIAASLRHDPILLVGTFREDELYRTSELAQTLAGLAREPSFSSFSMEGLGREDVGALLEQTVSREIPPDLVDSVATMTEGNPFFVVELARLLNADGAGANVKDLPRSEGLELPASITATIERRLGKLTAASRRLLATASVIGREFTLARLSEVAGPDYQPVLEHLEEAVEARIIEPMRRVPGTYRFSHALIRETFYQGIMGPARAQLHRSVAEALEHRHGDSNDPPLAALAHHWYAAVATGAVEKAAEYSRLAGLASAARLAFEEAAFHLRRALELADLRPVSNEREHCENLLDLGKAEWNSDNPRLARATFARAAALARQIDSSQLFARAAIGYYGFEQGISSDATTRALLEEAVGWLDADSPELRACVLAKLQHMTPHADRMETRRSMSLEALDLARSCQDPQAMRDAFRAREMATVPTGFLDERLEWEAECREWGERLSDPWLSLLGNDVVSSLTQGDRAGVLHSMQQSSRFAAASGDRMSRFVSILQQSGFAMMEGRFDDLGPLIELIPEAGKNCVSWSQSAYFGYLFVETLELGKFDQLKQDWLSFFDDIVLSFPSREVIGHASIAVIHSLTDDHAAAMKELDQLQDCFGMGAENTQHNENWIFAMRLLGDVIERLGTKSHAGMLAHALEPSAEQVVCHSSFRWAGGSVASTLGLLSSVLGNFEAGIAQFEAGLARETALGAKPAMLRSQAGLARLLMRRGTNNDRSDALALMDEVVTGCEQLGIDPREKYIAPFERVQ